MPVTWFAHTWGTICDLLKAMIETNLRNEEYIEELTCSYDEKNRIIVIDYPNYLDNWNDIDNFLDDVSEAVIEALKNERVVSRLKHENVYAVYFADYVVWRNEELKF